MASFFAHGYKSNNADGSDEEAKRSRKWANGSTKRPPAAHEENKIHQRTKRYKWLVSHPRLRNREGVRIGCQADTDFSRASFTLRAENTFPSRFAFTLEALGARAVSAAGQDGALIAELARKT